MCSIYGKIFFPSQASLKVQATVGVFSISVVGVHQPGALLTKGVTTSRTTKASSSSLELVIPQWDFLILKNLQPNILAREGDIIIWAYLCLVQSIPY